MGVEEMKGRTLLLTGVTGSFGSAFIRYLIKSDNIPNQLIAYSRDWLKQKELRESLNNPDWIKWVIGDVRDKEQLYKVGSVTMVIHAAAIKDLPTCEKNPEECMKTNIVGTQNIIDYCKDHNITQAVLISTDKAVLPINVYGTSKKMAEKLWIASGYNVARYGNVIGSAGSVLPLYRKLIAEGAESLPVTEVNMTRFWFNMDDAIKLVFNALSDEKKGEVFIPDMPSIRIIDLCKALNMPYHIIGVRQGEKLHEDLIPPDSFANNKGLNSGNNKWYLTIEEIKESIENY
jgi:UDP-N-acetylglucosamine 4,6-dehydratase/5-epimerase